VEVLDILFSWLVTRFVGWGLINVEYNLKEIILKTKELISIQCHDLLLDLRKKLDLKVGCNVVNAKIMLNNYRIILQH
jgi:hypothetical protein